MSVVSISPVRAMSLNDLDESFLDVLDSGPMPRFILLMTMFTVSSGAWRIMSLPSMLPVRSEFENL